MLKALGTCGTILRSVTTAHTLEYKLLNRTVERYRSPKLGRTTTMSLPLFSLRCASLQCCQYKLSVFAHVISHCKLPSALTTEHVVQKGQEASEQQVAKPSDGVVLNTTWGSLA